MVARWLANWTFSKKVQILLLSLFAWTLSGERNKGKNRCVSIHSDLHAKKLCQLKTEQEETLQIILNISFMFRKICLINRGNYLCCFPFLSSRGKLAHSADLQSFFRGGTSNQEQSLITPQSFIYSCEFTLCQKEADSACAGQ